MGSEGRFCLASEFPGEAAPNVGASRENHPPVVDIATISYREGAVGPAFLDAEVAVTVYFGPEAAKLTVC